MKDYWLHQLGVEAFVLRRETITVTKDEPRPSPQKDRLPPQRPASPTRGKTQSTKQTDSEQDELFTRSKSSVKTIIKSSAKKQPQTRQLSSNQVRLQIDYRIDSQCAILYDRKMGIKKLLVDDLVRAMIMCLPANSEERANRTGTFEWPPDSSHIVDPSSKNDDVASAARALKTFLTEDIAQVQLLLLIGDTTNSLLNDSLSNKCRVLRVRELDSAAAWKRKLWTEMQS